MLFEDDDIVSAVSKPNPKVKNRKKQAAKKPTVNKANIDVKVGKNVKEKPKPSIPAKMLPPIKPKAVQDKPKNKVEIQDTAGIYDAKSTIVVHKTGDYYWTICKEDAAKLTDHQIYCYFYKRFGYKAHELDIVRPKAS